MRRGPKTEQGKKNVRFNALTHGFRSKSPVIPSMESDAEWSAHIGGLRESLKPVGYLEEFLVERIAYSSWQLRRIQTFETALLTISQSLVEETAAQQAIFPLGEGVIDLDGGVAEKALDKEINVATQRLHLIRRLYEAKETVELNDEDGRMLEDAIKRASINIAGEAKLELAKLETELLEQRNKQYPWIIDVWTIKIQEMSWLLLRFAENEVKRLESRKRDLQATIDRLHEEQLVLDEQTIAKITRYQSHHHRQFLQNLHELEALQARQRGESTPLARVDVQVLGEG